MLTNEYLRRVYEGLEKRNANEPEFLQAVREVLESIQPVVEKHPEYEKAALIERLVEPERIITFRVPWVDDQGQGPGVNRGYRGSSTAPSAPKRAACASILCQSGHPEVPRGGQLFKSNLTTLPMGGGRDGSDFDPRQERHH